LFAPMLAAASVAAAVAFSPAAPAQMSRPCVRTESPQMLEQSSRRELFARAGAAAVGFSAVQAASAKAGQFSKISVFDIGTTPGLSSPFQPGGPKAGKDATFGYGKSAGPILADGYSADVTRETAAFEVSAKIVASQAGNIDSKTWWLVRDNLRGQAYNMKANMIAINKTLKDSKAADAAYKKFWKEIDSLDLACKKKELALAQKEYKDVLDALEAYKKTI